jgi:hypothetical protein
MTRGSLPRHLAVTAAAPPLSAAPPRLATIYQPMLWR